MSQAQNPVPAALDHEAHVKILYENERMRLLGRRDGFIRAWWQALEGSLSNPSAFELVNNEYYEYFGEFRYKDYESFRVQLSKLRAQNNL